MDVCVFICIRQDRPTQTRVDIVHGYIRYPRNLRTGHNVNCGGFGVKIYYVRDNDGFLIFLFFTRTQTVVSNNTRTYYNNNYSLQKWRIYMGGGGRRGCGWIVDFFCVFLEYFTPAVEYLAYFGIFCKLREKIIIIYFYFNIAVIFNSFNIKMPEISIF